MVFAPMLEESDRLLDGLAFLLIDGAAFKLGAKVSIFRDSAKFFGRLIADNHFFS